MLPEWAFFMLLPILFGTIIFLSTVIVFWIRGVMPSLDALGWMSGLVMKYGPTIEEYLPLLDDFKEKGPGGRPQEGLMGFLTTTPLGNAIQQWVMGAIKKPQEVIPYGP